MNQDTKQVTIAFPYLTLTGELTFEEYADGSPALVMLSDDCGCRASDATERPESIAPRHPGATQSPDGSQGATEHVEITPDGNVQVMTTSWHEGSPYSCARPGCPAGCDRNDPTTEAPSDVRPSPPARDAVSMDSAVTDTRWSLLADKAALMGDADRLECEVARLHELVGELRGAAAALKAENARLVEEATVSAALLEIEIAKRESAEMRANRATADLDALESEDRRQDVQAKHWREVLRIRRELDGIRREMNDATEIIAKALGYRPSGLPLDGWPHLSTTGDHTPTSLAAEAAGVLTPLAAAGGSATEQAGSGARHDEKGCTRCSRERD